MRGQAKPRYTCKCDAYPFPHRSGSGHCAGGDYWCEDCGSGDTEVYDQYETEYDSEVFIRCTSCHSENLGGIY